MKIGFIAMSGVRAQNEALTRVGLTLPGFVERSRVIASLPSLSLLTLAALTPPDIEVEYREIKDLRAEPELPRDYDLVAISSFSAQILDAYQVADGYRAQGIPVVLGGLHVTVLPEEAAAHADSVVIGEGEAVWPRVVDDFVHGRLQPVYRATESFDLATSPVPRYELLDLDAYNRLTVQTSRGCPHRCEFCASSILLTPGYRVKPIARVLAEIRYIKSLWRRPFIEFADDNSFVLRRHYKALLRALRPERIRWFTETDISVAEDAELLALMRDSGCQQVLIGLESPGPRGLDGLERRRNWKLAQLPSYEAAIARIQAHGITVNGCFILGLDGDTPEVFERIYAFVERTGLYDVQITVQTPFPGTPLYARLKAEGRLVQDGRWDLCTLFDVNFRPQHMSPEALQQGLIDLARRLYAEDFIAARRRRFWAQWRGVRRPAWAAVES
jgi:radical SAM superfamily enzyme YgiQ (UPF0313 family)